MSTQAFEDIMTELRPPEGFGFNYEAYSECGVVAWRGPAASTDDQSINISFEWTPSTGITAVLDALDGAEYSVDQIRQIHAALGAALAALGPLASDASRKPVKQSR